MAGKSNALRGIAIEKFGTITAFADAMNWSQRKASYITNGRQTMTTKDVEDCAEVLGVDNVQDFMRIFYPQMSIRWTA